jgi:hypothetical protein
VLIASHLCSRRVLLAWRGRVEAAAENVVGLGVVDHGRVGKVDRALEAQEDLHPVEDVRARGAHPLVVAHREAAHGRLQQPEADPFAIGLEPVVELEVAARVARLAHQAARRLCAVPRLLLLIEFRPVVGVVAHTV